MLNQQRGPWKVDTSLAGDEIHVRPRNDLMWHPLDPRCACGPQEQTVPLSGGSEPAEAAVYLHAALDGREVPPPTVIS
jgi:hypothetical protein